MYLLKTFATTNHGLLTHFMPLVSFYKVFLNHRYSNVFREYRKRPWHEVNVKLEKYSFLKKRLKKSCLKKETTKNRYEQ